MYTNRQLTSNEVLTSLQINTLNKAVRQLFVLLNKHVPQVGEELQQILQDLAQDERNNVNNALYLEMQGQGPRAMHLRRQHSFEQFDDLNEVRPQLPAVAKTAMVWPLVETLLNEHLNDHGDAAEGAPRRWKRGSELSKWTVRNEPLKFDQRDLPTVQTGLYNVPEGDGPFTDTRMLLINLRDVNHSVVAITEGIPAPWIFTYVPLEQTWIGHQDLRYVDHDLCMATLQEFFGPAPVLSFGETEQPPMPLFTFEEGTEFTASLVLSTLQTISKQVTLPLLSSAELKAAMNREEGPDGFVVAGESEILQNGQSTTVLIVRAAGLRAAFTRRKDGEGWNNLYYYDVAAKGLAQFDALPLERRQRFLVVLVRQYGVQAGK